MALEALGERERVGAVPLHPHRERLQAAGDEERIERARHRADRVLQESEPLGESVVARDRHPADHVRMTVEILRRRVHDDVEAELERPLHPRRGERVVRDRGDAAPAGDRRHRFEIHQLQQRIRRRLDPDHARLGRERRLERLGALERQVGEAQPGALLAHALEEAPRAPVEIVERDHVRARVEQLEHRGARGHPGGERERGRPRLERRDARLVGPARRVVRAPVVESLVHAGTCLDVGRGGVDRRDHRSGRGIGRLPGVEWRASRACVLISTSAAGS